MKLRNLLFAAVSFMIVFASCKGNNQDATTNTQDTAGLAAFRQQKLIDAQLADQAKIDSLAQVKAEEMNAAKAKTSAVATRSSGTSSRSSSTSRSSSSRSSSVSSGSSNDGYASAPAQTQTAPQRQGISKAAKGAMIGAGTGAVAGAIINKRNRAAGAVIGGVVGGAAGYGIGRSQDKKDGRY